MDMETIIAQMTLVDWLDDLTVRFLLNLPPAELSSVPRLCFQVEEAQWFYEDFIRPANPSLPSLNLRQFCLTLFQHCPLLSGFNAAQHLAAYEEFLAYKVRVPVRGAILMDEKMEKVLLVRGWKKGASWSFPRGKINKNEPDLDCAIREVYEETGYDIAAAGLVERNLQSDGQVKSIDVTMREQHMKLFVFRGVPLETYFEPKTRKEISKISWYNIKDLPGFKKQKGLAGQGTGEAQAAKFYMVAPFLGHLKRFINQQKRNSVPQAHHARNISAMDGFQSAMTEDEGDPEPETSMGNALGIGESSADELKRLLSINSGPMIVPSQQQGTNNLLAMLRGSQGSGHIEPVSLSFDPRTPFDQIDNPFPSQPQEMSRAHPHPELRPDALHQEPPLQQFQHPAHHSQQFQPALRNASMPMSGTFGAQESGAFGQVSHLGVADPLARMQQQTAQQQRQHSLPSFMHTQAPRSSSSHQNHQASLLQAFQSRPQASNQPSQAFARPSAPLASPMHIPHYTDNGPSGRPVSQGLMGAQASIGSGPSAPEASKLPPPNLNAHSMKLLDAFKSKPHNETKSTGSGPLGQAGSAQSPRNQQQTALLDLFRKPSNPQTSAPSQSVTQTKILSPVSPTFTDDTVTGTRPLPTERRPTFNEITRTLPAIAMSKSPVAPSPPTQTVQTQQLVETPTQPTQTLAARPRQQDQRAAPPKPTATTESEHPDRPKAVGNLYNPASPQSRASSQNKKPQSTPKTLAPAQLKQDQTQGSQSPRATGAAKTKNRQHEASQQAVPQFSILQRPGSSSGKPPRSPAVQSPLRFEGSNSGQQLKVLKRPISGVAAGSDAQDTSAQSSVDGIKNDQLLALFGKSKDADVSSPPIPPVQGLQEKNNTLLSLLNGRSSTPVVTGKKPEAPPAPQLLPERKPSYQGQQALNTSAKQNTLLNLFTAGSGSTSIGSPGTPISPFTLGTPAAKDSRLSRQHSLIGTEQLPEPRSRVGSMASPASNGSANGQQTPTEAKDFLLGYLQGVVQKEGYRGAK